VRLRDLDASFLKRLDEGSMQHDVPRAEADGIIFLCPKCFVTNGGAIGTHSVICWFVGRVPDSEIPGPGRWNPSGVGIDDLTFVGPGATSVLLTRGCAWHGHVVSGDAT
jgi:hypothetical protein